MPTYTIKNKITNKTYTEFMTISEMTKFQEENSDFDVLCGVPVISSGVGTLKPTGHLKEKIMEIKRKTPGHHMDEYT